MEIKISNRKTKTRAFIKIEQVANYLMANKIAFDLLINFHNVSYHIETGKLIYMDYAHNEVFNPFN